MKNRILFIALLALMGSMLFGAKNSYAQNRRGEPNVLPSGYYVVDSDDNAPMPWRPTYFFMDTLYQPFSWYRIKSGPRQFFIGDRPLHYFREPYNNGNYLNPLSWPQMDTTDDAVAGPIPIGFTFDFYGDSPYGASPGYDSLYISTNGYIGFAPRAQVEVNSYTSKGVGHCLYCNPTSIGSTTTPPDFSGKSIPLSYSPPSIIAALYSDLDFRPALDSSKVYIRTSPVADSMFISYFNVRMRPPSGAGQGSSTAQGIFPFPQIGTSFVAGADRLFIKKMQIVITHIDSSIQINYGQFVGTIQSQPPVPAYKVFQRNSSIGVINAAKTQATSVNFGSVGNYGAPKGRWDAINNINCRSCNKDFRAQGQYAVKFKRWHNVVRAISVDFPTRNYEVCLSTTLNPQATFMWIGNYDINGVLTPQAYKAKFQIRNSVTGVAVYGRTVILNTFNAPGQKQQTGVAGVTPFAPYVTNPYILNELGTFNACAIATSYDQNDNFIGDTWPFDDTVCLQIFGIRTTALPFNDPSDGYSTTQFGNIPDQTKWIAIGATVEDGDAVTFDPPPPRYESTSGGVGQTGLLDPVIHLDRQDINGNTYIDPSTNQSKNVGDTLVSFPFNLQGQTKALLSFSYQRAGYQLYPWFWDAQTLVGPEQTILTLSNSVVLVGDSLIVEFKNPNQPACNPARGSWLRAAAIDGGNDFEFHKPRVPIRLENFTTPTFSYFTNNFRFRLRLRATDQGLYPPDDDADDWYIDNISLQVPRKPEIEIMWVRVVTPYTHIPPSQAVALPIYVHVANNSTDVAIAFPIRVQILDPNGNTVYWALETITSLRGGTDSTILMPNWNAQAATAGGNFTVHAFLASASYDSYTQDNGTFQKFFLDVGQPGDPTEFALDDGSNDLPGLVLQTGAGMGFFSNSASMAMKFRLSVKDTMFGVRVFFANGNQAPEAIRLTVLKGSTDSPVPSCDTVFGAQIEDVRRGQLFNQYWSYYFPQPVVLPGGNGSAASNGVYWVSVSQLATTNYMMGADVSRGGGRVSKSAMDGTLGNPVVTAMYNDPYGTNYSANNNFGDVSTSYAVERTAGSCDWSMWMPESGGWWPANDGGTAQHYYLWWSAQGNDAPQYCVFYGTFEYCGYTPDSWNDMGTYNPMIRPMISTSPMVPVNFLTPLTGKEVNGTALLNWSTAQEKNNQGFYVERRLATQQDGFFEKISFVDGKINSNVQTGYSYTDRNVSPGTYTYRLTQVDLDGAQRISNTVNVTIGAPNSYSLEQNYPNPCTTAQINFSLPIAGPTRLVVYNALGQAVRTLVDGDISEGTHNVRFDGKDDAGNDLASGNYIYRLQSGDFNATRKLTLTK